MNNFSNKMTWNLAMTQMHVEPPPIPLIEFKNGDKSDKNPVKIKLQGSDVISIRPL